MRIAKLFATCLLVLAGTLQSWGLAWHHGRIQLQCEPADAGYVYASTATASTSQCTTLTFTGVYGRTCNTNYMPTQWNIYTRPVDPTKYKFLYWECTLRVGDYLTTTGWFSSRTATAVGTQYTTASVEGKIYVGLSKDLGTPNTGNKSETTYDPQIVNAIWVAHYEELEHHDVTVSSNNNALGSVAITGPDGTAENQVGDVVNITARTENHKVKFLGWKLNGEWVRDSEGKVIRDVPYSFTVTEQNKGKYVAYFEGGHDFVRIKNRNTGHYISAQKYFSGTASDGLMGLRNAISTFSVNDDLASSLDDQGSVIKWSSYPRPNTVDQTVNVMEIRGVSTEQYYTVSSGIFLYMTHNADNTYDIGNGANASFHIVESNGKLAGSTTVTSNMNYLWDFEGMDLDLTTKENYYTPDALIQGEDGLWYGTHRASWNTKYDTEQITAYVVTGIKDDGSLELTEVTGGIIPTGMAVLLKCQTNDPTLNVMIPTLSTTTFTSSSNLLTTCENYFPQQSVSTSSNYKALCLINGRIGFGGSALDKVDGNHGYMQLTSNVTINNAYTSTTLANLIENGVVGNLYNITDLTAVRIVNNDQMIIAKDNNGYATKEVMPAEGDYVDYMHTATGITNNDLNIDVPDEYDQSNWIALRVPAGTSPATSLQGQHLTGVKGRLVNTVNPEFALDEMPGGESEGAASTALNTFIPASFSGTQTSTVGSQKTYFFVQPKPMEMANITWAQWDGEKFIAPVHDEAHSLWNTAELVGSFELNAAYLEDQQGGGLDVSTLKSGHVYAMTPAVIKKKTGDYNHVYVLGNVNGLNEGVWNPNKGVEMETNDGITYTAIVNVNDATNDNMQDYGYFSFTKKLGASWEDIKDYRFGSTANGEYWGVLEEHYNTNLTLKYWSNDTRSFQVPVGTYILTVTLQSGENSDDAGYLVIKRASAQAPRREGAAQQYVVYPVTMTKITAENENGVVTGVSTLGGERNVVSRQYVNLAGVRSSQPWNGVNIVITTYSDGTTTATKQLH